MNINSVSSNSIQRAAQRVIVAKFERERAHKAYMAHIKSLKDSKEAHDDQLLVALRRDFELAEANLKVAHISHDGITAHPPLH